MPDGPPEPELNHNATTAGRAPVLWIAVAVLAGYTLAAFSPGISPKSLAGWALPFALVALALSVKAPLLGFRQKWRLGAWGACFLLAATLLAWAWRETRVRMPSADWATLPSREATLTLRVTRKFRSATNSDYSSGLAEVVAAPTVLRELQGQSLYYRLRSSSGENSPARDATVEITGLLNYLPVLAPDPSATAAAASAARFQTYLHAQGAWFELSRGRLVREVAAPGWWSRWLVRQHARLDALLRLGPTVLEKKFGDIYVALVLGEPTLLDAEQRQAFTVAGTIYLFAISGLHVAVLAAALWWAWRRIPGLPHAVGDVLTLALLWLYVEIAGGSPSARRAAFMLTFYLLSGWIARGRSQLAAVLASGILMVLADPLALNNAGFQLSYGVVLGLILYAPALREAWHARWAFWRDVPAASLAPWKKCVVWLWKRVQDLLATSTTALLCSAPLTAEFFGIFSAHSLTLTLVMFPLTCVVLRSGAVAVAVGIWGFPPFTWLAWLVNTVGLAGVGLMQAIAKIAPPIPGLVTRLQVIPPWAGSAATLAVLAAMLLTRPRNRAPRWWYFWLPVLVLALFAIFTMRPL